MEYFAQQPLTLEERRKWGKGRESKIEPDDSRPIRNRMHSASGHCRSLDRKNQEEERLSTS